MEVGDAADEVEEIPASDMQQMVVADACDVEGSNVPQTVRSMYRDRASQCDMRSGYIDFAKLKGSDIKSLTGFDDIETFHMLLYILQPAYRKEHASKRYAIASLGFENDVLLTVTKLRNNLTNSFLGTMFDISTSQVSRVFKKKRSCSWTRCSVR